MSALDRKEIPQPSSGRAHVVILGAGASLAAFPKGDRHGRKLMQSGKLLYPVRLRRFEIRMCPATSRETWSKNAMAEVLTAP